MTKVHARKSQPQHTVETNDKYRWTVGRVSNLARVPFNVMAILFQSAKVIRSFIAAPVDYAFGVLMGKDNASPLERFKNDLAGLGELLTETALCFKRAVLSPKSYNPDFASGMKMTWRVVSGQYRYTFDFQNEKPVMQYFSEDFNKEKGDNNLKRPLVEAAFLKDADRNRFLFKTDANEWEEPQGTPQEKLAYVNGLLTKYISDEDKRVTILNCLQQTVLIALHQQVHGQLEKQLNNKGYLGAAFEKMDEGMTEQDQTLWTQFSDSSMRIKGQKYFKIWTSDKKGEQVILAYMRTTITIDIPDYDFTKAQCRISIDSTSTQLADITGTASDRKVRQVFAKALSS